MIVSNALPLDWNLNIGLLLKANGLTMKNNIFVHLIKSVYLLISESVPLHDWLRSEAKKIFSSE